jgi:hypothetical protein
VTGFNPLGRADDRDNFAPREDDPERPPSHLERERPVPEPEEGFVRATPELLKGGGMTVRVWRGARWRTAYVTGKRVLDYSIVSVQFLDGGEAATPHIKRVAVKLKGQG